MHNFHKYTDFSDVGGELEKSEGGRGNARKQTGGRTEYMKEIALMNIYAFLSSRQTFRQQNWKIAGNDVVSKFYQ